ncbi:energy transducer TonB [Janthinobacterium fluminis]|uniref:Energy transducer TonB n=1 Tax=Janthinobacterium fluminis TaxID=2987524 RepID=A0ABT5JVJ2_9BURK|nr:energy transducer TonB [Janthinobacterium fluminis]MDC8756086.1 energy transducer TonB [Janthinobacterium fluminis]
MKRMKHLRDPSQQATNRKIAIATLAVVLGCLSVDGQALAADKATEKIGGTFDVNSCSKPAWPEEALAAKKTGVVTLALLIGKDGKVKQSKVAKSSGHPELDDAARTGIAKCAFTPGKIGGEPAEAWLQMQYVWTLD